MIPVKKQKHKFVLKLSYFTVRTIWLFKTFRAEQPSEDHKAPTISTYFLSEMRVWVVAPAALIAQASPEEFRIPEDLTIIAVILVAEATVLTF